MFGMLRAVSETGARKVGPWILPQRVCDLIILILRSVEEDEPTSRSIWRRLPVLAQLILIIERWQRTFNDANDRLRTLEEQNESLKVSLISIQSTLQKIVIQNDEIQDDIFELHKRILDLQEDSLTDSLDQVQGTSDDNDSIPGSSIREASMGKERQLANRTPPSDAASAFGRLFSF